METTLRKLMPALFSALALGLLGASVAWACTPTDWGWQPPPEPPPQAPAADAPTPPAQAPAAGGPAAEAAPEAVAPKAQADPAISARRDVGPNRDARPRSGEAKPRRAAASPRPAAPVAAQGQTASPRTPTTSRDRAGANRPVSQRSANGSLISAFAAPSRVPLLAGAPASPAAPPGGSADALAIGAGLLTLGLLALGGTALLARRRRAVAPRSS